MNFVDQLIEKRIWRHLLFWVIVVVEAPLLSDGTGMDATQSFIMRVVNLPLKIISTYWLAYYLVPRFLQQKKYFLFLVLFCSSAYLIATIYRMSNVHLAEPLAGFDFYREPISMIIQDSWITFPVYFRRGFSIAFIFLIAKFIKDRLEEKHQLEVLQKEKATTELNFLKAQIHPHFLFNTLNNLYALSLEKSDDAPEVVAKLSDILDYMLYQCNDPTVLVSNEIQIIKNYIDLERIRYGERLKLSFDHHIDDPQAEITPLVLLSIVENAFKHGVSGAIFDPTIKIKLEVKNKQLLFEVYNTKSTLPQQAENGYRRGIGVANVKRQLELVYPHNYTWEVEEGEMDYQVSLNINL